MVTTNRKLQQEVDRVLKKVQEGLETFDDILKKVYAAPSVNLKEKHEAELKKEIKKLQRYRDQIKVWVTLADIKNKEPLLEQRKVIESRMEQFKQCEKETKTKPFSTVALAMSAEVTEEERQREELRTWIGKTLDTITTQIDACEAELLTIPQKKRKQDAKAQELATRIERHRFHINRLERILRLLDNERLAPSQIYDIKDSVDYFVEGNAEPDYMHDETLYDCLELQDLEAGMDKVAEDGLSDDDSDRSSPSPVGSDSSDTEPSPPSASPPPKAASTSPKSGTAPSPSAKPSVTSPPNRGIMAASLPALPALNPVPQTGAAQQKQKPVPQLQATASAPPQKGKAAPPSPAGNSGSPAPRIQRQLAQSAPNAGPQQVVKPMPPLTAAAVAAMPKPTATAVAQQQQQQQQGRKVASLQTMAAAVAAAVASGGKGGKQVATEQHKSQGTAIATDKSDGDKPKSAEEETKGEQQQQQQQQQGQRLQITRQSAAQHASIPASITSPEPLVQEKDKDKDKAKQKEQTQKPKEKEKEKEKEREKEKDKEKEKEKEKDKDKEKDKEKEEPLAAPKPQRVKSPQSQTQQQEVNSAQTPPAVSPAIPPTSPKRGQAKAAAVAKAQQATQPQVQAPQQQTQAQAPQQQTQAPSQQQAPEAPLGQEAEKTAISITSASPPLLYQLFEQQQRQIQSPSAGVQSLSLLSSVASSTAQVQQSEDQAVMLGSSYMTLQEGVESERSKQYLCKQECQGAAPWFPSTPLPGVENPALFQKLDADTLFFVFYYQPHTYQQYLAALELKRQSWRYHKKYQTWFQRHEEPKEINNDYETGTYCYFDYETGWCQRRKAEFTFEYRFLEE